MKINFGNLEGPHFQLWRINKVIVPLITEYLAKVFSEVEVFEVFYDAEEDYDHCKFMHNGREVDIRFYKRLAFTIDGVDPDLWPHESWAMGDFTATLKKHLIGQPVSAT